MTLPAAFALPHMITYLPLFLCVLSLFIRFAGQLQENGMPAQFFKHGNGMIDGTFTE
jgi:hypothetical protein